MHHRNTVRASRRPKPPSARSQRRNTTWEGRSDADLYADAGARIMTFYRERIDGRSKTGEEGAVARKIDEIEASATSRLAGGAR